MLQTEIERKYLVHDTGFLRQIEGVRIAQAYLTTDPDRTVRVRRKGNAGYLTIKGASSTDGLARLEWEKEIDLEEAQALFNLCLPTLIDKTRYEIPVGQRVYEVDIFHGANEGLVIAEIELPAKHTSFDQPSWLGTEVTGDIRYYNSYLSKKPFTTWP